MDVTDPDRTEAQYLAPNQCTYSFRPVYYRTRTATSWGFTQDYLTLSHVVPDDELDREADLSNCNDGIRRRNGVNNAPELADFSVNATQGQPLTVQVADQATDPDSDDIQEILRVADVATTGSSVMGATAPTEAGGSVKIENGKVTYTPPSPGFVGPDSFHVRVTDGDLHSTRAKVTVNVA
jgi:hypothetical protein